ncbi:UTP-glucose-1-phosphate uridylyltransferase [Cerrena zonata]|uniref:UTP--glucose-1-phosphate uridylyltransferase n=1 Tax=Cerrena zonata TaxID=2478898 RepID=A0AAW0G7S7_9APHY
MDTAIPKKHIKTQSTYAFDNTATTVAASQMRNALNNLADTVTDSDQQSRFENEMDSFFALFRRYLSDKASGSTLDWDKIKSPSPNEVVQYNSLEDKNLNNLSKLAVLKLNGGLGTSMGCVGPKSVIEVRDVPESFDDDLETWYPPGHGDLFESLVQSGELDSLLAQGRDILFVSNGDNLGATVDTKILDHMIETGAEYIMELTDKTRADVKGGTLINYDGQVRLLEIAQVPKEHVEEFKSIKKFKYFNTNNLWINLRAIKKLIESNSIESEIIPNQKTISKGSSDINVLQLETAVGAAIRHFDGAHGVVVPRSRFLPVKTCSDLLLVKSDLFYLEHGALKLDPTRDGFSNPLIKLGSHFKKVSGFQSRIPHMPKILELDHLTITGNVNLGRNVTLKGTVIIVVSDGQKIDIPNGSILENVVVTGNLSILEH